MSERRRPRPRIPAAPAILALLALSSSGETRAQQIVDATATMFPVGVPLEWSNQVTAGDLDGDGDLDLLFANGGNFSTPGPDQKVRVYINFVPINGRFRDLTDARTGGHAGLYRGVELGDCEADGDLDILLAQDFNRLPGLLINDGAGFFTSEGSTRLPAITLSSSRGQFGDVDNDGDLDVFFTSGSTNRFGCGQYRLYLNDGSCHYTDATSTHFPLGNVCENMDAIFGDIDNDFDLDLKTASTGVNSSHMYRNDGSGVFTMTASSTDSNCYSYDFGDMDGDGDLDLLGANGAANGSLREILLENDGTGAYSDASSQITPNPTEDDNDSKFFDYDNDGDLDLIIARLGSGGEKLYRNDGAGNFTLTSGVIQVISDSSLDVIVGDFDGNGTYDVVTAQGESGDFTDRIYRNNGPADTLPPRIIDTEQHADTADSGGPYVVRALILDDMTSDRNFFDHGIVLSYTVNAGPTQTTAMRYSGGQVYRGAIPGQAGGSTIAYWVTATDFNDNTALGAVRSFEILGPVAAGRVPASLTLAKAGGSQITLAWGASCLSGDDDYAIYTGSMGNFSNRVHLQCDTSGATSASFLPAPGDRYYLVVPHNGSHEGSYGTDSDDNERSPAAVPCFAQLIATCP